MLFSGGSPRETIIQILLILPAILIALTVHEYSHGYIAYKLGDPTARNLGRLTLNPIKHIDPFGFIMLLIAGFGWAKPVPINTRYLKKGRFGVAMVSLAGPVSNLILAFFGMAFFRIFLKFAGGITINDSNLIYVITLLLTYFVMINIGLAVFNLLPIPPLDGSRILAALLPPKLAFCFLRYERYIQLVLFALLFIGVLSTVIGKLVGLVWAGINMILDIFPFL